MQDSQYYSLWSFPECPITYFFACPTCRKIWDVNLIHNYTSGSPLLKIPCHCPDCDRNGDAFAESKTGMVEEIRITLTANEIDSNKKILNGEGDLPGLFRLNLRHSYLDMRVIAWEAGGPAPFSENPPNGWPVVEEFENQFEQILRVIDSWWQDEPFMIEILNERINKRMNNLINSSIYIPVNSLYSKSYDDFIDKLVNGEKKKNELTAGSRSGSGRGRRRPRVARWSPRWSRAPSRIRTSWLLPGERAQAPASYTDPGPPGLGYVQHITATTVPPIAAPRYRVGPGKCVLHRRRIDRRIMAATRRGAVSCRGSAARWSATWFSSSACEARVACLSSTDLRSSGNPDQVATWLLATEAELR